MYCPNRFFWSSLQKEEMANPLSMFKTAPSPLLSFISNLPPAVGTPLSSNERDEKWMKFTSHCATRWWRACFDFDKLDAACPFGLAEWNYIFNHDWIFSKDLAQIQCSETLKFTFAKNRMRLGAPWIMVYLIYDRNTTSPIVILRIPSTMFKLSFPPASAENCGHPCPFRIMFLW